MSVTTLIGGDGLCTVLTVKRKHCDRIAVESERILVMKQPNSKAGRIRSAFNKLGWDKSPKEIKAYLKEDGMDVNSSDIAMAKFDHNHVNYVQLNVVKKNRIKKSPIINGGLTLSQLKESKLLKEKLGSFDKARNFLDSVEKIGGIDRFRDALNLLQNLSKLR
jgi:hypothetical protein